MSIQSILPQSGVGRTDDLASSFAADLARRMGKGKETAQPGAEIAETDPAALEAQARENEELTRLESALGGTVSYMADRFGDKAASAMMGIMYKSLGEGAITEESLGNAFLDVIRFVDKNFGFDAGNGLMDHLNGSLNQSMNDFFDNGLSEVFMAVPVSASGQAGVPVEDGAESADSASAVAGRFTDAIKAMLEEFIKTERENGGIPGPYAQNGQNPDLVGMLTDITT